MKHRPTTVTQGPWFVGGESPVYGPNGSKIGGFRLSVHREIGPETDLPCLGNSDNTYRGRKQLRGDGDGMIFDSQDAGFAWAFEHGYLQTWYRRTWCPKHRTLHFWIGHPTGPSYSGDLDCWTREDQPDPRGYMKRLAEQTAWLISKGKDLAEALRLGRKVIAIAAGEACV